MKGLFRQGKKGFYCRISSGFYCAWGNYTASREISAFFGLRMGKTAASKDSTITYRVPVIYHVIRPICARVFRPIIHPCDSRDNSPVCVEGRCPIFDILPLQGANVIKPSRGGDPGCRSLRSLYPGLRYPCPYRAPRLQNH